MKKDLDSIRAQINDIDQQVLYWLNQRAEAVTRLSNIKKRDQMPIIDRGRELDILDGLIKKNKGPLSSNEIKFIYEAIFKIYRERQKEAPIQTPQKQYL